MAEVVLRIKANEGADVLIGFSADEIVNNVSSAIGTATTDNNGVNGKSFATGFLSLKDGFVGGQDSKLQSEVDKYNGFMFGATDSAGNYTVTLSLQGENLDKVVLVGDKAANQFPTTAILDEGTEHEKTIHSDDANWAIGFDLSSGSHTIKFTKWNRPNYNACFTTLKVMIEYLELDKGWIDSIESLSQSTSDPSAVRYGVIASSGNAVIRDLNGEIKEYIQGGIIPFSNVETELVVNGTILSKQLISDSDYDNLSQIFNIQQSDELSKLNDMIFSGINLSNAMTAFDLMEKVLTSIDYNINLCATDEAKSILKSINIEYPYLEQDTYANTLQKFCDLAQLQIVSDKNGRLFIVGGRPRASQSEINAAIKVPAYLVMSKPTESVIVKNKINKVSYTNKTYKYTQKKVASAKFTYYKQTDVVRMTTIVSTGDNSLMYSGLLKDYTWIGTSEDDGVDFDIIGLYDMDASSGLAAGKGVINKMNFQVNEQTKFDNWLVITSEDSSNRYPFYEKYPLVDTTAFLMYVNESFALPYYYDTITLPFNIVQTEEEALNNLLTTDKTKIKSPFYQIILNGRDVTIYYPRTVVGEFTHTGSEYTEHYKGDLSDITFSATNDIYVKSLVVSESYIVNESSKDYVLPTNELMVNNTTINEQSIIKALENNIINDYRNGLSVSKLDIFCGDLYSINGVKVKNWAAGEMVNIGDILCFDKDYKLDGTQRYWRVTGSKFIYDGSPRQQLELQEIVDVY